MPSSITAPFIAICLIVGGWGDFTAIARGDELAVLLNEVDNLRDGSTPAEEVERVCEKLLARFPAKEDQARILYQRAHTIGQGWFSTKKDVVEKYAREALAVSTTPLHRLRLFIYLGDVQLTSGAPRLPMSRREDGAREYLKGLRESLAFKVPDEGIERGNSPKSEHLLSSFAFLQTVENGQPILKLVPIVDAPQLSELEFEELELREAEWNAARPQVDFLNEVAFMRRTLIGQLVYAYSFNPPDPEGFRKLAPEYLDDPTRISAISDLIEQAIAKRRRPLNPPPAPPAEAISEPKP